MVYILNKKVHEKSTIKRALMQVFGVGPYLSDFFCKKIGIQSSVKVEKVSPRQISLLTNVLLKDKVNSKQEELSRELYESIASLLRIRTYRGLRHKRGLPLRGQRTRTNSKTANRRNKIQNRLK